MSKQVKITVVILACLLALGLAGLGGVMISRLLQPAEPAEVTVPDNVIGQAPAEGESGKGGDGVREPVVTAPALRETEEEGGEEEAPRLASALYLNQKTPEDNQAFRVTNMFPGDAETKTYCVHVSHKATVTLRFHADLRTGSEKLAEVLQCRIVDLRTGEALYDGLMRDMPAAVTTTLSARSSTVSEAYYEITASLDTSVGNEYQDKELIADFRWWVEETENLDPPQTGDVPLWPWAVTAGASLFLLVVFLRKSRKEAEADAK